VNKFKTIFCMLVCYIYRVFQRESAMFGERMLQVKVHRYNQKYLYLKLNVYGDIHAREMWPSCAST
jgi:hypothetical protein